MPAGRIARRLQLAPTDQVLEVGCGPGFFSPAIARSLSAGHLTLFDAQGPMLEMAAQRLTGAGLANFTAVLGLADKLPFPDAAFDVVFMITVLGEVPDRATAVKEAARVLRPGARFSSTEAAGDPDRVSRRNRMNSRALLAWLKPKAGRACWSRPSTTASRRVRYWLRNANGHERKGARTSGVASSSWPSMTEPLLRSLSA